MAIIELWVGHGQGLNFESGSKGKIKVELDNYDDALMFIGMILHELRCHVGSRLPKEEEELEKRKIILQNLDEIDTKLTHLDLMKFFGMR